MPTSADRPSTHTPTRDAPASAPVLSRLAVWGLTLAAFLASGIGVFMVVPQDARVAVAGTALVLTGIGIGLVSVLQARANQQILDLRARIKQLSDEVEAQQDLAWHLKESDARHRDVLNTLGDVVIRWQAGGDVVYANDAAIDLFPDKRLPISHPPAQSESDTRHADTRIDTPQGPRWFSRRDVPVRDHRTDQPLVQTILRDVTARRQVEDALVAARNQAESANASKSRFLATVSHEIRTPLNGILGMAGLLRDTRLTREQTSYLDAIRSSGEILLMLINEVLDMSKIEAGRLDLSPAPVDLVALAEGVTELLAPRAQAKGLEIACYISPDMPARVVLDGVRLRQILFNLAGNGLKFTEAGGVSIEIAPVDEIDSPSHTPRFSIYVTDTGIGFSDAEAERLFGEFEQVDHGPARQFDGAGLGLAISRRLARMMGGDVTATSTPGHGAQFRAILPLTPAATQHGAIDEEGGNRLAGHRVAFVTNGGIEAPLLARRLAADGADIDLVAPGDPDGDEALLSADLILLDPKAIADAGAWLAGLRAVGAHAPAIVMIAPTDRDRLPRLKAAGFGAYLIRPVRAASLRQILSAVAGDKSEELAWEPRTRTRPNHTSTRAPGTRPLHVLVADDNDINRLLTEALMRKLGHECTVVADGAAALDAVTASRDFDIVLMDLHMPGMDGLTAIRRFRAFEVENGWPAIPVFAVTADVTPEARDAALVAGADAVLAKPLDPDLLAECLTADTHPRRATSSC